MVTNRAGGPQGPGLSEVLFEFQRHGNIMRVTAIDPKSGTEVIMIADPRHSQTVIKQLAMRKLLYVMNKKAGQAQKKP